MENASKAMLISGGVLIAMLVISIGVYLFANYSNVGSSYENRMEAAEIQKFNVNFTKFEGRTDITIHEIVTLTNFVKQYEEKTGIETKVYLAENELKDDNYMDLIEDTLFEWDEGQLNPTTRYFKCVLIEYNEKEMVKSIKFN